MDANKLIELSQDFICTTDFKGRFASVNPACLELIGYTQDELLCKEFFDLVHPEDMEKAKLEFASLLDENKTVNFENRLFHKDGTIKYISWKASLNSSDNLIYVIGREITEHKKAKINLKESEEKYRMIFELAGDAAQILQDDKFIDYNEKALSLLKGKKEQLIGLSIWDLSPQFQADGMESKQKAHEKIQAAMAGASQQFEWQHMRLDGSIIDVEVSLNIIDREKKICISIWRDITERKLAERALKTSEEKFKNLADIAQVSISIMLADHEKGVLYVNKYWQKLTEYTKEESLQLGALDIVHPEHRPMVIEKTKQRVSGEKLVDQYELKIITKSGQVKWVDLTATRIEYEGHIASLTTGIDITERKKNEELLEENQELLNETGLLAKVGGWKINLKGQTLAWTDETFRIHELDASEQPDVESAINFYHPDDRIRVGKAVERTVTTGEPFDLEARLITARGTQIWVRAKGNSVVENSDEISIRGIIQDITERKLIEKELIRAKENAEKNEKENKENANFINGIIVSSAISTWVSDGNGTAIMTNPACLEFFGATEEEVIGKYNVFQDSVIEKHGFMPLIHDLFEKGKSVNFIIDYNFAEVDHVSVENATHKIINTIATPIFDLNGKVSNAIFQTLDLSDIKKNESELIKAKEKAEEADLLKTAFLTNMSHEIRTPLNAVIGFSELLTRPNISTQEKTDFSEYIRLNGESLAKIIDDIIDISKLQSKQLTINKTNFNLKTLFNELYNYYLSVLVQKSKDQIKLELDLPHCENTDCFIRSDEQRLKQIMNNLISNAIKYTEKGSIVFGYKLVNNKLLFFVNDTGYGIAKENLTQIFDRFVQFSQQYLSKQEGTGLGLSICKNLVHMLGGELKVESKLNVGSKFYFQIPLIKVEKPAQCSDDSVIDIDKDLSKYKILIADDEDSNYVLTKRILKPSKVTTDWAQNGKHAVEMAANNNYDLILMDIKMPEMDGIEATRRIRKQNKNTPIIMQTAFAMKEIKDEALEAGCNGFIVKPIALKAFIKLVNKHVK